MAKDGMDTKQFRKRIERFLSHYRVDRGKGFRLRDHDPTDTHGLEDEQKDEARELLQRGVAELSRLQEMLYAQDRWAVLLIFQAMDAAGKDGTIKHVMSGVNPQGVQVFSFKQPSSEELDHDFLWRAQKRAPERGRIGIFNRSYYEETLVVRVHPELLARQYLPPPLISKKIWAERFEDIAAYERYLSRNGILVRKFFLNVSHEEQRRRFLARIDDPDKNWKFSMADAREREHWNEYMRAYQETIRGTASKEAPWFVVPADHKWFTRLVVAAAVIDALYGLDLAFPKVDAAKRRELLATRRVLESRGRAGRKKGGRRS
jgi:PPK2 family polyphosphate:nucleotide phosphotransferase